MKRNIYCGIASGLLAAALIYPSEPLCWLAAVICLCLSAYWLSKAEQKAA